MKKNNLTEKDRKRLVKVGISGLLTAGLLVGSVEYASHTWMYSHAGVKAAEQTVKQTESVEPMSAAKEDAGSATEVSKEETVYAVLGTDGSVNKVIVSNWLKNSGSADGVSDVSDLQDIVNTKGDEKFAQNGNQLQWETSSEDIYYQGSTNEELPVGIDISYELDGKEVQAKDIVGKSGKLKIRIKYTNRSTDTATVDGKKTEIYTPFIMVTGMILPVDKFTNVTIDNGHVISEGDNDIVVGYGMPGLSESLDLENLDLGEDVDFDTDKLQDKLTDTVEITADVKDFSMGASYTVATSDLFQDLELDDMENEEELDEKLDEIKDASSQLMDGTEELQDGLDTLNDNFETYSEAIDTVNSGVKTLNTGAKKLKKGTDTYTKGVDTLVKGIGTYAGGAKKLSRGMKSYVSGVKSLSDGINTLNRSTASLPKQYKVFGDGVKKFVDSVGTLLSEENMKQMTDGTAALQDGVAQLDTGVKAVQGGVSNINKTVSKLQKTEELDKCVAGLEQMQDMYGQMAEAATGAEKQQYQQMEAAVTGAIQYIEGGEQIAAGLDAATNGKADGEADQGGEADLALALSQIQAATDTQSKEQNLYNGAAALNESSQSISSYAKQLRDSSPALLNGNTQISTGIGQISAAIQKLQAGSKTITANNKTLTEGADSIIKNTDTITKGGKKLKKNSPSLRKATKQLSGGTRTLADGLKKLVKSTGKVADGISKLADGSGELKDGMNEFHDEAIVKVTDTVTDMSDGLGSLSDRVKAVSDASGQYQSFSGLAKGMQGSVKFVMTTEEVK